MMSNDTRATVTLPTDEQILITREFDAPRNLVYEAWTTPELIVRWWSGRRGQMTLAEVDLRVGGRWRYAMRRNDGQEIAFHGEFREIAPNARILTTEVFEMPGTPEPADSEAVLNTVTFSEHGGRTRLEILVQTPSKMVRDLIVGSGMEGGMQEQMDTLEGLLTERV